MNNEEFMAITKGIFAAHNKPLPKDPDTLVKWFDRCKEIPLVAAKDIARKLEDCPKLEGNFSAQFLEEWRAWRAANPTKCSHEITYMSGCEMCDRGWIYSVRQERMTVHVAPCGHCSPFVPNSTTQASLEARGYLYVPAEYEDDGSTLGQRLATYRYVTRRIHESLGVAVQNGRLQFVDELNRVRRAA